MKAIALTEFQLIEKLQSKDKQAFKELFEQFYEGVYSVCFRLLGSAQDSEDVTQEVFIKAFKSIRTFRKEAKLSTWLYRIAYNLSLNHLRRGKGVWQSLDQIFEVFQKEDASPDKNPHQEIEQNEKIDLVHQAILNLPEEQRAVIVFQYYQELTHQEIAEVMETTVSSVESRIHRAKKRMARFLLPRIKK